MTLLDEGNKYYENLVSELRIMIPEKFDSISEVARKTGIDVSTISRIINGKCKPTFPVLHALYTLLYQELEIPIRGGVNSGNHYS